MKVAVNSREYSLELDENRNRRMFTVSFIRAVDSDHGSDEIVINFGNVGISNTAKDNMMEKFGQMVWDEIFSHESPEEHAAQLLAEINDHEEAMRLHFPNIGG